MKPENSHITVRSVWRLRIQGMALPSPRLILLTAIISMAGCATTQTASEEREMVDGAQVARSVVLCQTKIADLQSRLGEPSRDGVLGRTRILTWVVSWDPLVKYLGIMADNSGTVVDVYWNLPSEVQWSPVNRCR